MCDPDYKCRKIPTPHPPEKYSVMTEKGRPRLSIQGWELLEGKNIKGQGDRKNTQEVTAKGMRRVKRLPDYRIVTQLAVSSTTMLQYDSELQET